MVGSGKVEMVTSKGCSKVFSDVSCTLGTNSFRDHLQPPRPSSASLLRSTSNSPFSGLVICVTGLSKEARKQVMDATERLGGEYSPHLNPHCTHLVLQISFSISHLLFILSFSIDFAHAFVLKYDTSNERNSSYALKHGTRLFIVTLGWFVDSVRRNVRLNESLYAVKSFGENHMANNDLNRISFRNSCLSVAMLENAKQSNFIQKSRPHSEDQKRRGSNFSGQTIYIDPDISADLRNKVVEAALEEGALLADRWLVGHDATYVVCEGSSVPKYLGHTDNLVTPLWILKEIRSRRLIHLSADLARHVGLMLGNVPGGIKLKDNDRVGDCRDEPKLSLKEKQSITILAKNGVRNRRVQAYQTSIKPPTRNVLLDSINWNMSEPSTTASVCMDSFSFDDSKTFEFVDGSTKEPMLVSEKSELVSGNHFITILFPVDRFLEMGPCSRTFFSNTGFTCSRLLDHIYAFYQENLSTSEIELAIHTDSRHADRLRSLYSSNEAAKCGFLELKRIDFLGSRKSFEMLKRVPGDNNNNVYKLLTRP
ncbi:hypothetical protein OSB04_021038 [Centaurea solstitialis]|uniref:BRCT domain-containing protein n=1 Tax=Centaurea solstitialis TaxID=347529 RepID=A0AA38WDV4_9ASTR|nr:hypothetical protein OSB04_021038 [Centaurea solstitialis]